MSYSNPSPRAGLWRRNLLAAGVAWLALATDVAPVALAQADSAPAHRARVEQILGAMTLDEKLDYLGGTGFSTRPLVRQHVRPFMMSDGSAGVRTDPPATTAFSAGIGLAASWDPALAERVGQGMGAEARTHGFDLLLGPGVNLYRSPLNGRNFEYFGEDPVLASRIAVGYIDGIQSQGVGAVVKHLVGNESEYLRHVVDTRFDERTLREVYLIPFEAAVKQAHVAAVMDSYNEVNGAHMTQNVPMNIGVLRHDWGFDGLLVSDWVSSYDGVAEAIGGLDLEMPFATFMNRDTLLAAIHGGTIPVSVIDDKVRHTLTMADHFGWLDGATPKPPAHDVHADEIALQLAREGLVLLKNDGLLPLDRTRPMTVLVTGPDADPAIPTGGGSGSVSSPRSVSILEGLRRLAGPAIRVEYDRGIPTLEQLAQATSFTRDVAGAEPGMTLEAFTSGTLTGTPAVSVVRHVAARGVSWSDYKNDQSAVNHRFATWKNHHSSRRWTGYYHAATAGRYVVALRGPGEWNSNRLVLDGHVVFDNWNMVRAYEPSVTLSLSAGAHRIVVEDAENGPLGGTLLVAIAPESTLVNASVLKLAKKADVVVAAVGFDAPSEAEGGDRTFSLPVGQDVLLRALAAQNRNVVATVTAGGGVDMAGWIDQVRACIQGWYGGQEAGTAIAETLFGDNDPSGRLPITLGRRLADTPGQSEYYPVAGSMVVRHDEGVFVGYRGYQKNGIAPLFPFGYGLSYTHFGFSHLAVRQPVASAAEGLEVSFDVTNLGARAGAVVPQLYVGDRHAPVPRPAWQLEGFDRVVLTPGETRRVTIPLDARSFAYFDTGRKAWRVDPGTFDIMIGNAADDAVLRTSVTLKEAESAL